MTPRAGAPEQIRALATVTLDAQALDELGPQTLDRLADLVVQRLEQRRAAGEAPLLNTADAAQIAGVHADTVRRAIRSGALKVAGYVGQASADASGGRRRVDRGQCRALDGRRAAAVGDAAADDAGDGLPAGARRCAA